MILYVFALICIFTLSTVTTFAEDDKDGEIRIIVSHDEAYFDTNDLTIVPSLGLYAIIDSSLVTLDEMRSGELEVIELSSDIAAEKIVFAGDNIIIKDKESLFTYKRKNIEKIFEFDQDNFDLWNGEKNVFYLTVNDYDKVNVYKCNRLNRKTEFLTQIPFPTVLIVAYASIYVIVDNLIYVVEENGNLTNVCKFIDTIESAAATPLGIIVSSSLGVYLLQNNVTAIKLLDHRCLSVFTDDYIVYLLTDKHDIISFDVRAVTH